MSFADYWDGIICIHRYDREDRRDHISSQSKKHGICFDMFDAHSGVLHDGKLSGNAGCTASHRGVLEIIAQRFGQWLILEDDFEVVEPGKWNYDHDARRHGGRKPFHDQWAEIEPDIPENWDMRYLGGHFAEPPIARVNKHIVKIGRMFTTSSYGITAEFARKIAPYIFGVGPIDTLYGQFHRVNDCFIVDPRLMVQYTNKSDLSGEEVNNAIAMLDPRHISMV